VKLHETRHVKFGLLEDLDFADVYVVEWVDAVACLLNVPGNAVWDQLVDDFLQVIGGALGPMISTILRRMARTWVLWAYEVFLIWFCLRLVKPMQKRRSR